MQTKLSLVAIMAVFTLSACGGGSLGSRGTDLERAAIGGLAGCVAGDLIDEGKCITGAILGAGAGALVDDLGY